MLLFIDESFERDDQGMRHVYAGFAISERNFRRLTAALHQLRLDYFLDRTTLEEDEARRLGGSRLLCNGDPARVEIKATKLLSMSKVMDRGEGEPVALRFATSLLDEVTRLEGVVFGVLSYPNSLDEIQIGAGRLATQFKYLLERVDLWMQEEHPQEVAIPIFDTVNAGVDRNIGRLTTEFLFRSSHGKGLRNVLVSPLFVDSQSNAGSQVADMVAHILLNGMRPPAERKPFGVLWQRVQRMEFRSRDMHTRGIRQIRRRKADGD